MEEVSVLDEPGLDLVTWGLGLLRLSRRGEATSPWALDVFIFVRTLPWKKLCYAIE